MAALTAGTKSPGHFPAPSTAKLSRSRTPYQKALPSAAFFKVSCPVCQYTFPYLERLHKAQGDQKSPSSNLAGRQTQHPTPSSRGMELHSPLSSTIPTAIQSRNEYGLTNVPPGS